MIMYEHTLTTYRERHHLTERSRTADMDMMWNMATNPYMSISSPHTMIALGNRMAQCLNIQTKKIAYLQTWKEMITPLIKTQDIRIQITSQNLVLRYGTYSIQINLIVNGYCCKMADLTMHDGYGSQQIDDEHRPILDKKMVPLIADPTYCTAGIPGIIANTMLIPLNDGMPIRVPTVTRYIHQQLFAIGNLLLSSPPKEKAYILWKRVVYLIQILRAYQPATDEMDLHQLISFPALNYANQMSNINSMLILKIVMLYKKQTNVEENSKMINKFKEIFHPIRALFIMVIQAIRTQVAYAPRIIQAQKTEKAVNHAPFPTLKTPIK